VFPGLCLPVFSRLSAHLSPSLERKKKHLEQGMEEAPGEVFVVMRDAMGGGAHRGLRKAGVEGQWG
jgi:hypothetical protein